MEQRLQELLQLEEDRAANFHQEVYKAREKAWNDRRVKKKTFQLEYLVLLYYNKFLQHLGKLQMYWMGPYTIHHVTDARVVQLKNLEGTLREGFINGSKLKISRDNRAPMH